MDSLHPTFESIVDGYVGAVFEGEGDASIGVDRGMVDQEKPELLIPGKQGLRCLLEGIQK